MPLERAEFLDRLASRANALVDYAALVLNGEFLSLRTPGLVVRWLTFGCSACRRLSLVGYPGAIVFGRVG